MRRTCFAALLALGLAAPVALACASLPDPPAPGRSEAWGSLRLVPREGVTVGGHGGSAYGDRRLRDVQFVDYSHPGFAIVYVAAADPPAGELELSIRDSRVGAHIEPAEGAVGAAGRVAVRNQTGVVHVVSYPAAGRVQRIGPGEQAEFDVPREGEQGLFVLDLPGVSATVFASPGPYSVVSPSGRFTLTDLEPGDTELRVWHPRFPPAVRRVHLPADAQVRVDFEIGVGRGQPEAPRAQ